MAILTLQVRHLLTKMKECSYGVKLAGVDTWFAAIIKTKIKVMKQYIKNSLELSQRITIEDITYEVSKNTKGYYLSNLDGENNVIFKKLDIKCSYTWINSMFSDISPNKPKYPGGFPEITKLSDLTKVVNKLIKLSQDVSITIEDYQKHIHLACDSWKSKLFHLFGKDLLETGQAIISKELIDEMYNDGNDEVKKVLEDLFPGAIEKTISCYELKVGEALETREGQLIIRIAAIGLVDLKTFQTVSARNKGKKVQIEINKIEN